jgi:hypothetical protein
VVNQRVRLLAKAGSDKIMDFVELLPKSFSFYDKGQVTLSNELANELPNDPANIPAKPLELQNRRGVGFRIYHLDDAPSAILIFLFDTNEDESMYTEMGNILASKLCQSLSEQEKSEMMISPPIQLQSHQLLRLASQHTGVRRVYSHSYLKNDIETSTDVETWTLPLTLATGLANGLEGPLGNV